ncbi:non-structural maintenance of chromosomes element 4 homolog A [Fagus crenata]
MRRTRRRGDDAEEALRAVKREKASGGGDGGDRVDSVAEDESTRATPLDRRVLRSKYFAVKNMIKDQRDDLTKVESQRFSVIIGEVDRLHELVQKPREQVADAEALLDIANTLASSVKSHSNEGITPADFVSSLLKEYGQLATQDGDQVMLHWNNIGLAVAPIFSRAHGCCTMLGPMNTEFKPRKTAVHKRRVKPTESANPEELDSTGEEKTDTDKNMATMFGILRRMKHVRLESLILNRKSYAQTVENLFALSFLVKDGRAEINVDGNGSHLVSPRNAPAADSVMSGEVAYGHFVFRFDFKDWKLMMDVVPNEEELMPHRNNSNSLEVEPIVNSSQATLPNTPIRKLSRNRGRVVQEQSIQQESSDSEDGVSRRANAMRRCKRKLT